MYRARDVLSFADLVSCYIIIIAPAAYGVGCDDRFRISRGVRPEVEIVWRVVRPEGPVAGLHPDAVALYTRDLRCSPIFRIIGIVYMFALLHSICPVIYFDISERCFQTWWSIFYTIYDVHGGPSAPYHFIIIIMSTLYIILCI